MQAITLSHRPKKAHFSNDFEITHQEIPKPQKNEVLVKVYNATITIDDINIAEASSLGGIPLTSPPTNKQPATPGIELSGIVETVGVNVTPFKKGDAVFGSVGFPIKKNGAWAEYCSINEKFLMKKPEYLSFPQAAACAGSGMVATCAIAQCCNIQPNDTVLIIGASGGVGSLAVQIAKQKRAYVIAVCSKKNEALVKSIGANRVIDYHSTSFAETLKKENNQMDYVIDFVGGKEIEHDAFSILKPRGSFVTAVGPIQYLGDKKLGWSGIIKLLLYITTRIFSSTFKKQKYVFVSPTQSVFPIFKELIKTQSIHPIIDKIIKFNKPEIKEAIDYVRSHKARGKVVVEVVPNEI
ncbi:hypothetical protein COB57_05375 [Candidatus Peregrinibacteria bacterium]|nr:MAG: hypothetical protein COB57_05375 [Candidatus Peregrinibacteria bacterium]